MLRRSFLLSSVLLPIVVLGVGCSGPETEDAISSESDLVSVRALGTVCGEALVSEDGRFALLNQCPSATQPDGKLARFDFDTRAIRVVATYGKNDYVDTLVARGGWVGYTIVRNVDRSPFMQEDWKISSWEIGVAPWDLSTSARVVASGPAATLARAPHELGLTKNGSHVWYFEGSPDDMPAFVVQPTRLPAAPLRVDTSGLGINDDPAATRNKVNAPLLAPDDSRLLFVVARGTAGRFQTVELTSTPKLGPNVAMQWGTAEPAGYGPPEGRFLGYDGKKILHLVRANAVAAFVDFDTQTGRADLIATPHCASRSANGADCVLPLGVFANGDINITSLGADDLVRYERMPRKPGAQPIPYAAPVARTRQIRPLFSGDLDHVLVLQGALGTGDDTGWWVDTSLTSVRTGDGKQTSNARLPRARLVGNEGWHDGKTDGRDFVAIVVDGRFEWYDVKTGAKRGTYAATGDFQWVMPNSIGSFVTARKLCGSGLDRSSSLVVVEANGTERTVIPCAAEGGIYGANVPKRSEVLVYAGGVAFGGEGPRRDRSYTLTVVK